MVYRNHLSEFFKFRQIIKDGHDRKYLIPLTFLVEVHRGGCEVYDGYYKIDGD
jgi:hypothetical protein